MKRRTHEDLREFLQANPDGLTVAELYERLPDVHGDTIARALRHMPDAFIIGWAEAPRVPRGYVARWAVVIPPADAPHPLEP